MRLNVTDSFVAPNFGRQQNLIMYSCIYLFWQNSTIYIYSGKIGIFFIEKLNKFRTILKSQKLNPYIFIVGDFCKKTLRL